MAGNKCFEGSKETVMSIASENSVGWMEYFESSLVLAIAGVFFAEWFDITKDFSLDLTYKF